MGESKFGELNHTNGVLLCLIYIYLHGGEKYCEDILSSIDITIRNCYNFLHILSKFCILKEISRNTDSRGKGSGFFYLSAAKILYNEDEEGHRGGKNMLFYSLNIEEKFYLVL